MFSFFYYTGTHEHTRTPDSKRVYPVVCGRVCDTLLCSLAMPKCPKKYAIEKVICNILQSIC